MVIDLAQILIRPIHEKDLDALFLLAEKTGAGLTSLPADKKLLEKKIQNSIDSFKIKPSRPGDQSYLFVLESAGKILATSAIKACIGGFEPFYSYETKTASHKSEQLQIDKEVEYLQLKAEHDGPSLLGTLFVDPEMRGQKLGKYMSLVRFLFIADNRERFKDDLIAEMRGVVDANNHSPFWDGTVRHFFDMDFNQADYLSAKDKSFIGYLMPRYPIYIPLLKQEVIDVIAKVDDATKPGLKLLKDQGFKEDGHVDIFDAGPRLYTKIDDLHAIKNSRLVKITELVDDLNYPLQLVSNASLDFRAVSGGFVDGKLTRTAAEILQVKKGDSLRIYEF